ncbi:MAG: M55 family metallopeptidase [Gemmatimonadales bacterium]
MKSPLPVLLLLLLLGLGGSLSAQTEAQQARTNLFRAKRVPHENGFRVFIVPDMEGMGSVVDSREVLAGNETPAYAGRSSPDYWDRFRLLLTKEVNATIGGARLAGARSFTVNEGHGGNLFANVLPWDLDTAAMLVRGFPKPLIMITGIDSTFGTLMFTGAHAGPGMGGVMSHNYSFDAFTVNGTKLNEVGINALIAGEMGVSVSLVSGDDALIDETRTILGKEFVGIVTKRAVGRSAAITYSPAKVRAMLHDGAAEAVRLERAGKIPPFTMKKPYTVDFTLRASYPDSIVTGVKALKEFKLDQTGPRTFRLVTSSAREMGYLLDAIESVVLR